MANKQTVELFCGTKSFSKVAEEKGYNTFTIDNDAKHNPDICIDILNLNSKDLPQKPFILWASPPCTAFSVASIGSSWCGNYCPKRVESALGMAYVLKTLQIIKEIKPTYFFIENPRGVLRNIAFMNNLNRKTVTYCKYGDNRMKPTDIWTNCIAWIPKKMCKNKDSCHISAPRGSKTGTQGLNDAVERAIIPPDLFKEIFEHIENPKEEQKVLLWQ